LEKLLHVGGFFLTHTVYIYEQTINVWNFSGKFQTIV